jgi:microcin C transport system permease protein
MFAYIVRRLLLIIPTLLAIITINFFLVQMAPGGPVDQMIAKQMGLNASMLDRVTGNNAQDSSSDLKNGDQDTSQSSKAATGLTDEDIEAIKKQFGFDRPMHERYFSMLWGYLRFDFGDSLFRGRSVSELIIERLPVSISLGLWTTLLVYLISIPLGIRKAITHSSRFDIWTTSIVLAANAVPSFLFAVLLIIVFAGGNYFDIFPLRGLVSNDFEQRDTLGKIADYFNHMFLPVVAMTIGGFASLTMLTKNSFLDEIHKQYVITAKAKGLTQRSILYNHVFRNAMLIIIAGFPAAFIGIFFTGSLLIEVIFSLDGLGLLGYEATLGRDYPVIFATLYIFGLVGLLMSILSDVMYSVVDPRINFNSQ